MWLPQLATSVCLVKVLMGARILSVFPIASLSHQVVFRALTLELARRGHELLVLTTDPAHLHTNITEIDMHDIAYPLFTEIILSKVFEAERTGQLSMLNQYATHMEYQRRIFETMMNLPEVIALMQSQNEHFDLILVESITRPVYAFRHKFKAPLIPVSSLSCYGYTYDAMGIPTHPLFYPDVLGKENNNLNVLEKAVAIYDYLFKYFYSAQDGEKINALTMSYFGEDTPGVAELEAQTDMLFMNVNPIWDGIKATPPNVFFMWGSHLKPPKELPTGLKRFLDNSPNGVVYMSLGSNMKSTALSADRLSVFLETFRGLRYDVLWKWEADELPDKPDNVRIEKWLPQADLLRHPNIKAFITQGGLQSTDEALSAGVPLVGIPFFGDQEANVERYKTHGVGVALNTDAFTIDQLEGAIKSVTQEKKYRDSVQRVCRLLADEGVAGGVERAARWVEYVIRHGGAQHLRSPAAGVSAVEYFMLDVVAALALAASIGLTIVVGAVYFISFIFKIIKKCIIINLPKFIKQ